MKFLLRYLEIILSILGVAVTFAVPLILKTDANRFWQTTTWSALIVATLHGIIFWLVRRRRRHLRREICQEIRAMLEDRINNHLQTILLHTSPAEPRADAVETAAIKIKTMLHEINDERLTNWQARYQEALAQERPIPLP